MKRLAQDLLEIDVKKKKFIDVLQILVLDIKKIIIMPSVHKEKKKIGLDIIGYFSSIMILTKKSIYIRFNSSNITWIRFEYLAALLLVI